MTMPDHPVWEFLVVCGDTRVRESLTAAIHEFGGNTNWTGDTGSALAYISRRKLDGIFIDMRVDGALKLIGSIRRGSSNRYSAIFACTTEDEHAARLLNSGVSFIVHKTLTGEKIRLILEGAVQMMLLERQRYLRHQLTLPVTVNSAGQEQEAVTANISRGGMAVRCGHSLEPGRAVNFVIHLSGTQLIHGQGEVAWAKSDGNMGIKFYLLGNDIKQTLWNWIDEFGGHNPA